MKGRGSSRDAAGMNTCGSPVHVSSDAPRLPRSHALEVPGKILIDEPCASQKKTYPAILSALAPRIPSKSLRNLRLQTPRSCSDHWQWGAIYVSYAK